MQLTNKRVKKALFETGMSQAKLAKLIGIDKTVLCRVLQFELAKSEQDKMIAAIKTQAEAEGE